MATLLEILAREWKNWPVNATLPVSQDEDGYLYVSSIHTLDGKTINLKCEVELSDDWRVAGVTRSEWAAARAKYQEQHDKASEIFDAIDKSIVTAAYTATFPEKKSTETQTQQSLDAISYEQKLWDDVAVAALQAITTSLPGEIKGLDWKRKVVLCAHEVADIHMAERAKRLKARDA